MNDDDDKLFALLLAIIASGRTATPLAAAKVLLAEFKEETK